MRSTCLRMHFLLSALGIRVVGRWDRAHGIFGDV
jgi:hypothetical protein